MQFEEELHKLMGAGLTFRVAGFVNRTDQLFHAGETLIEIARVGRLHRFYNSDTSPQDMPTHFRDRRLPGVTPPLAGADARIQIFVPTQHDLPGKVLSHVGARFFPTRSCVAKGDSLA